VPFEEKNTKDNEEYASELSDVVGFVTFPVATYNSMTIVGYDRGKFDKIFER